MHCHALNCRRISFLCVAFAAAVINGAAADRLQAQLLWSFETGTEGWANTGYASNNNYVSSGVSATGATAGTQALFIEASSGYGWGSKADVTASDPTRYNAFNTVAANLNNYTLDFDVTIAPDSFASVSNVGNFFLMNVAVNSTTTAFQQVFNVTPNLKGLTGTFPVSIPMSSLPISQDSGFYQLNIGSNGDYTNGPLGQGVKYYVDNIRFTPLPTYVEHTLFSWETPDDSMTTTVDERFEGWGPSFQPGHVHSISTDGATDGTRSLQINRQSLTSPNFSWGSQFALSSDTNPDPQITTIDPTLQGIIDNIVTNVNGATAIRFDVRFDDSFPNTPTFTKFGVHFTDDNGTFYDAEGQSINGAPLVGDMATVTIPLSSMVDNTSGLSLAQAGLHVGTNFLRIGLSTNTNGAGIYQIDNFRVVSLATTENADFNASGKVDGADFLIWQRGNGTGTTLGTGDANGNGTVNGDDLAIWKSHYGLASATVVASGVPEPTAIGVAMCGLVGIAALRRQFCRC